MAAGTNTQAKNLNQWVDGLPAADIQETSVSLGILTFWVDGLPYAQVYPSAETKKDTFMPFFWGI